MASGVDVIYAAKWLLPVFSSPLEDGAMLVRDGRIAAIGNLGDVQRESPEAEVRRYEGHAILPGAVNAHGHLGFRRGDEPEGGSFGHWMSQLIERLPEKASWTPEAAENSAREAVAAGTTYMAESSPYGECLPQLTESGMAGTVYAEFFPQDFGEPEPAVEFMEQKIPEMRQGLPPRISVSISVHAPYTIDPETSRLAARLAPRFGKLSTHVAESPEEVKFLRDGEGPLVEMLQGTPWAFKGLYWIGSGISPVAYAKSVGLLGPDTIAAHLATGVLEEDVERLVHTDTAVAHCPRSNRLLGCGVSPVPEMLERGVRVGMGTDGLWSSPSMNLFEETLDAVRLHGFEPAFGLEMATLRSAQVAGIEDDAGSLEPGKWADLAVVELPEGEEVEKLALESAADGGVAATIASGELIYNKG